MIFRKEFKLLHYYYNYSNMLRGVYFKLNLLISSDLRKEIKRNKALNNYSYNKRCFIIGNGPSLSNYDLTKLSEEYVFTVNDMAKTKYFSDLKSNFHLFFDPEYFLSNNINSLISMLTKMKNVNKGVKVFLPYRKTKHLRKLIEEFNVYYIYSNKYFIASRNSNLRLDSNIPLFQNVILYAIYIALCMGFKQIYLLGVDMTSFIQYFRGLDQKVHFYEESEEELINHIHLVKTNGLDNEFYLWAYALTFRQFKGIKKISGREDVKIFNASEYGGLDVFDRIDFDMLINI